MSDLASLETSRGVRVARLLNEEDQNSEENSDSGGWSDDDGTETTVSYAKKPKDIPDAFRKHIPGVQERNEQALEAIVSRLEKARSKGGFEPKYIPIWESAEFMRKHESKRILKRWLVDSDLYCEELWYLLYPLGLPRSEWEFGVRKGAHSEGDEGLSKKLEQCEKLLNERLSKISIDKLGLVQLTGLSEITLFSEIVTLGMKDPRKKSLMQRDLSTAILQLQESLGVSHTLFAMTIEVWFRETVNELDMNDEEMEESSEDGSWDGYSGIQLIPMDVAQVILQFAKTNILVSVLGRHWRKNHHPFNLLRTDLSAFHGDSKPIVFRCSRNNRGLSVAEVRCNYFTVSNRPSRFQLWVHPGIKGRPSEDEIDETNGEDWIPVDGDFRLKNTGERQIVDIHWKSPKLFNLVRVCFGSSSYFCVHEFRLYGHTL